MHKSVLVDKNQTPFLATLLSEFRVRLEIENGGPLTDHADPSVAFLLRDLADFCGLNTGERAVALGAALLVFLSRYEEPAYVSAPDGVTAPQLILDVP